MEERITVKVIFRVDNKGIVYAMFPEHPGDNAARTCSGYEHMGQHNAYDYRECIRHSRPAKPEEYAALASELKRVGYDLIIKTRDARAAMRKARYREIQRMDQVAKDRAALKKGAES